MMKKFLIMFVCVCLCLSILASCSGSGKDSATTSNAIDKTAEGSSMEASNINLKKCKLSYYYWNEEQKPVTDKTIELFNKSYPGIEIESTVIPWDQYWTKLQTSLPSGAGPDLFQLNAPHAVEYLPAGLVLPIQDKIERDQIDMSLYVEAITKIYQYNGQQYAMPKDYDSIALLYNKDMFDAAGVSYPDDSWTWDDLLEAAKKLTIEGKQYGFAVDNYLQTGLGNFIFQNGGTIFNEDNTKAAINSPENVETFKFLTDLMYVHRVSPLLGEMLETPSDMMFQAEQVAMITYGSWYVGAFYESLGDKLGIAPLPVKKTKACMLHGLGYCIDSKTKFAEEAWAFVKYCASKEAMEIQTSVVIPAYKGMDVLWTEKFPNLDCKVFTDAAAYGIPLPVAAKNSTMVEQVMYSTLDKVWNMNVEVADGLAEAEAIMNEELAK